MRQRAGWRRRRRRGRRSLSHRWDETEGRVEKKKEKGEKVAEPPLG